MSELRALGESTRREGVHLLGHPQSGQPPQLTSYARMRGVLVKAGAVCPTESPQLEDIHVPSTEGLTLLDYSKSCGIHPFEEIWAYVAGEVGLRVPRQVSGRGPH